MPPLLHRQAEAGGHRRPGRALRAPLRGPQGQEVALVKPELYQAKLRALARDAFGADAAAAVVGPFPGGATLVAPDGAGYVLADAADAAPRSVGGALAWARAAGVDPARLHLLVPADASGLVARRAAAFAHPPQVFLVVGTEVERATPTPVPDEPVVSAEDAALIPELVAAGAEPVVDDGVLVAEVLGLEVGRVVDGRLEVGVGKHDREAQKLMYPDRQPVEALAAAVRAVRDKRRPGAPPHPMNELAGARWLRAVVCARPALVGASELRPVWSTVPRPDLRMARPAPAAGPGVVVVCSTGIDVDLVPTAADERLAHGRPGDRLVLVVPQHDLHPVTEWLAGALLEPAEIVTVPTDWRAALAG